MKLKLQTDVTSFKRIKNSIRKAATEIEDLRIPLGEIHQRFMRSREFIFKFKNKGRFKDLSEKYKPRKKRTFGFIYPILKATGRLEKSITRSGSEHIGIIKKKSLTIGTTVPYGIFHNDGGKVMPQRHFLFWGPESRIFKSEKLILKQNKHMATTLFVYIHRTLGKNIKDAIVIADKQVGKVFDNVQ